MRCDDASRVTAAADQEHRGHLLGLSHEMPYAAVRARPCRFPGGGGSVGSGARTAGAACLVLV
jgi:hypothetical protein